MTNKGVNPAEINIIAGFVENNGSSNSGQFSSHKISNGRYRVDFTKRLEKLPVVLITVDAKTRGGNWTGCASVQSVSQNHFEVSIQDLGGGDATQGFNFLSIQPD